MNGAATPVVVIYGTRLCSYCLRAKRLLDAKGLDYREMLVDTARGARWSGSPG